MKAADGTQIAERYVGWYKALIHERVSDIKQRVTGEDVVPLIEELSRAEEVLISSGFKPSKDGKLWVPPVNEVATKLYQEKFAAEERERVLREALTNLRIRFVALFDGYVRKTYVGSNGDRDLRIALMDTDAALAAAPEQGKEAKS